MASSQTANNPLLAVEHPVTLGERSWNFLKRELLPTQDRLSYAARVALSAAIIVLVAETARSQQLFFALFVLLFLPRDSPMQTAKAALAVIAISISASASAIFLSMLVADLTWLRILVIALTIFLATVVSRGLRQPLIGVLFPVICVQCLTAFDTLADPEQVVERALWFALMPTFGVTVATMVEIFFPHPTPLQRVMRGVERRFRAVAAALKIRAGEPATEEEKADAARLSNFSLVGSQPLQAAMPAISASRLLNENNRLRLNAVLLGMEPLVDLGSAVQRYPSEAFSERQRKYAGHLADVTNEFARNVQQQDTAIECAKPEYLETDYSAEHGPGAALVEMGHVLDRMRTNWYEEAEVLRGLTPQQPPGFRKQRSAPAGPFFSTENVRHALKITLAAMIFYLAYNAVAWQGMGAALITCFIVAMDTIGATFRKLALYMVGAAIGGFLFGIGGIAFVLSNMDNVAELLLYVGLVFFVAGWVVRGSQRISYAGVQIGMAFALVGLGGPTIPYQIVEPRDRFLGILLGAAIIWYIFAHIWPVDALADQRAKISGLVEMAVDFMKLATEKRPAREKIDLAREWRATANNTIVAAEDQGDAAIYDSFYDEGVQKQLHECLVKVQPLLLIGVINVQNSVRDEGTPSDLNAVCQPATEAQERVLLALAYRIKSGTAEETEEVEELRVVSAQKTAAVLNALASAPGNSAENPREPAILRTRIVKRRQEFIDELMGATDGLIKATQNAKRSRK